MKLTDAQAEAVGLAPPPGIYLNVPARGYFRWPYLSKSGLGKFAISPAQYAAHRDGVLTWGRSDAMLLGSAVDVLWFDGPEAFAEAFACEPATPPLKPNGKPYKNWIDSVPGRAWRDHQEAAGRTVLVKGLWRRAVAMVKRLDEHVGEDGHPSARQLKEQARAQVSLVWRCPITGLWLKGRPDLVDFDRLVLTDLKTCADSRPEGFSKAITKFDYHWQAHLYLQALAQLTGTDPLAWTVRYIAIRNEPIHSVQLYVLKASALLQAAQETTRHLVEFRRCAISDTWPADTGHEQTIDLAPWRRMKPKGGNA